MPRGDRGGTSRGSGVRCVAAYCGNTSVSGVNLHMFPKNLVTRKAWTSFVRAKRKDWNGPTQYSALCSDHFTDDCYPFKVLFEWKSTGKRPKCAQLKKDAIPVIHKSAIKIKEKGIEPQIKESVPTLSTLETLLQSKESVPQSVPPKKLRGAYRKREAIRVSNNDILAIGVSNNDILANLPFYI
ncbi:hypothetical protein FSP39_015266 [Pinctada imbricata]|uniref:THAP-type domain-containing protein n=1 Tax=Pinctada imbricata TaxID=66713 RepID=A0AA89BVT0_PINIB|nr:hypothetical protein FSP39_015266 [Pinctada imbricata]